MPERDLLRLFTGFALAGFALGGCASERSAEDQQKSAAASPATRAPNAGPTHAAKDDAAHAEPRASATTAAATPGPARQPSADDGSPRVYAKARFIWIRPEPDSRSEWIGYLWTGGSVRLKSTKPRSGPGCAEWYAIEPQGFVCVDGVRATLDRNDEALTAIRPYAPDLSSPTPHRYGESIGLVRYNELPDSEVQKVREGRIGRFDPKVTETHGIDLTLPDTDPPVFPELARTIQEGRTRLLPRSTVAYSREARFGERGFLLAADFSWVPKDRVKPYPTVTFEGTPLGRGVSLPIAFFRGQSRPQYRRGETGELVPTGGSFPRLSFVELTGASVEHSGERYLEVKKTEPVLFVKESDAVIPKPRGKTPWGARLAPSEAAGGGARDRKSWIEMSILGGWLLAFEGLTPVYATMISPGRGGPPVEGRPTIETASTPTGIYPINGKMKTATMEADGEFIHSDVPWVQNFVGPYAIHTAYWHDDWGKLMSAGCVNVSPRDGKWLFEFTEPRVPEGWHATRWLPRQHPTTMLMIHN